MFCRRCNAQTSSQCRCSRRREDNDYTADVVAGAVMFWGSDYGDSSSSCSDDSSSSSYSDSSSSSSDRCSGGDF